jgi:hypothetical protein
VVRLVCADGDLCVTGAGEGGLVDVGGAEEHVFVPKQKLGKTVFPKLSWHLQERLCIANYQDLLIPDVQMNGR